MRGLCSWCLTYGQVTGIDVGPEQGTQRDPYRNKLMLCGDCSTPLVDGRLAEFYERYSPERQVRRDDVERD